MVEPPNGARPGATSRGRRLAFAGLTAVALIAAAEGALRLPWVADRLPPPDASHGFAPAAALLRAAGDRMLLRPGASRSFNPQSLARDFPTEGVRIVCLGGSSTFGYPYGDAISFPRFLAHRLEDGLAAGTPLEVVNLGGMSYGSHRVAGLVDTALDLEPDAVVVYSGHNEFVEAAIVRRVLESTGAPPAPSWRARTHLYAWLAYGVERLGRPRATSSDDPFGFDVARSEGRIFTLEEKARIVDAFEDRLETIARRVERAGVPVVLSTVPSNLRDWKPDRLAFAYPLPDAIRARFLEHLAAGIRLLELGEPEAALDQLASAEALDDRHATTAFLRARAEEATGRGEAARESYIRARDLDPIPIRATSAINTAVRAVSARTGVRLVDVERDFGAASPNGIPGRELFTDYCHPTARGHGRIADRIAEAMASTGIVELDLDGLPATPRPDETPPPEASLPPDVLWWLGVSAERQDRLPEARRLWRLGLERDPDHTVLLRQLAQLERRTGHDDEARKLLERLAERPTASVADHLALATLEIDSGRLEEAAALLDELATRAPEHPGVQLQRGRHAAAAGRFDEARARLEHAVTLDSRQYTVYLELGALCRRTGDRECAIDAYRRALSVARYSPVAVRALAELEATPAASDAAGG